VLFADHERTTAYPASVTKLMTFLLVLEDVRAGLYKVSDSAAASAYAASMEPSKVGIQPGQTMTVDDLLYSLMIKSANDAAVVLAEHSAWVRSGGKGVLPSSTRGRAWVDAFVARMNRRAHELCMDSTRYASPNGLPPGPKEKRGFDISTAADISRLCRHVVRVPGALKYTSCASRTVVDGSKKPFALGTHNFFLPGSYDRNGYARPVPGCDGLKTGYTIVSGSSIALTASRNGRRVVVVVLGCAGRHTREAAAGNILRDALGAVAVW
jgi:D-alanyl-D-alanine carboxypeptidase